MNSFGRSGRRRNFYYPVFGHKTSFDSSWEIKILNCFITAFLQQCGTHDGQFKSVQIDTSEVEIYIFISHILLQSLAPIFPHNATKFGKSCGCVLLSAADYTWPNCLQPRLMVTQVTSPDSVSAALCCSHLNPPCDLYIIR